MSLFQYTARSAEGRAIEGQIEASSAGAAAAQLASGGVTPVSISEAAGGQGSVLSLLHAIREPNVKVEDLVMFCRQMYTLTRSGVALIRALAGLAETSRNLELRRVLGEVTQALQAGRSLTSAFDEHPKVFPAVLVSTVHMGESAGQLENAFSELATFFERESETVKRIRAATRYPLGVVIGLAVALTILNLFVIPTFSEVFESFGAELPLPTRILLGTSEFFVAFWPYMIVVAVGGTLALRSWLRGERGRYLWHKYRLRMPVVGSILERATLARFARGFAMTSGAGLPIIQALGTVAKAVDNDWVAEQVERIGDRISRGEGLASSAASTGLFTPLVLQMISVGEETGALESLMGEVADYYEREVDYDVKRLSDSLEPLLIAVLGGMVLVLALGVYLPLWELANAAKG
jgi:MSHA biogenesis protein MshG